MEELQISRFLLWLCKGNQYLPDRLVVQCRTPVWSFLAWPARYKTIGECSLPVGAWDNMVRYSCSLAKPLRVVLPKSCRRFKVKLQKGTHTVTTFKAPPEDLFCISTRGITGLLFYRVGWEEDDDDGKCDDENQAGMNSGDDNGKRDDEDQAATNSGDDDTLATRKCNDDSLASEKCGDENFAVAKCADGILGVRARVMTFDEKYEVLDEEDYLEDPSISDSDSSGSSEDLASQEDNASPGYMECFYPEKNVKSFLTEEMARKLAARIYENGCLGREEHSDILNHVMLLLAVIGAVVMFFIPWAYRMVLGSSVEEDEPLIHL